MRAETMHLDRRTDEAGFTIIEVLVVTGVIAVLAAIAISAGFYAFDAARLGRSVADMRSISEAIARYKLDYSPRSRPAACSRCRTSPRRC